MWGIAPSQRCGDGWDGVDNDGKRILVACSIRHAAIEIAGAKEQSRKIDQDVRRRDDWEIIGTGSKPKHGV